MSRQLSILLVLSVLASSSFCRAQDLLGPETPSITISVDISETDSVTTIRMAGTGGIDMYDLRTRLGKEIVSDMPFERFVTISPKLAPGAYSIMVSAHPGHIFKEFHVGPKQGKYPEEMYRKSMTVKMDATSLDGSAIIKLRSSDVLGNARLSKRDKTIVWSGTLSAHDTLLRSPLLEAGPYSLSVRTNEGFFGRLLFVQ
jgi:hypothetical protein